MNDPNHLLVHCHVLAFVDGVEFAYFPQEEKRVLFIHHGAPFIELQELEEGVGTAFIQKRKQLQDVLLQVFSHHVLLNHFLQLRNAMGIQVDEDERQRLENLSLKPLFLEEMEEKLHEKLLEENQIRPDIEGARVSLGAREV